MPLFTGLHDRQYAIAGMPQPRRADNPWGEAIRYWMKQRNMNQADLVHALNQRRKGQRPKPLPTPPPVDTTEESRGKGKKTKHREFRFIQAKTVSRIVRGFHTQTRLLREIADVLDVPLTAILLSPTEQIRGEDRRRMIAEITEQVYRIVEDRLPAAAYPQIQPTIDRVLNDAAMKIVSGETTQVQGQSSLEPATTALPHQARQQLVERVQRLSSEESIANLTSLAVQMEELEQRVKAKKKSSKSTSPKKAVKKSG
jgi:transcriptional regulator with XRE-family HTH domain